jgi:histidinol-phosphate aminotransferase
MSKFWSQRVHELEPYIPGEQPKDNQYIKLNTNENPYPPSPKALAAIQEASDERLRLYSDPNSKALNHAIADNYELEHNQIFVGNSSDEVLAHVFSALLKQEKPLFYPDISYGFYKVYSRLFAIETVSVPLDDQLAINIKDYCKGDKGGIIFANPNAPTGLTLSCQQIQTILDHNQDCMVVVDEAYVDFGAESAVKLINQYPNLLVVQTFSKSRSLAGLRVGFAMGHADLIEALERVKNSFNAYPLGRADIVGAAAAMRDKDYFEACCNKIIATRQTVTERLKALDFDVLPSCGNFLFVKPQGIAAKTLYLHLKEQGILVRYFAYPRINDYLRITIGTDADMQTFLHRVHTILHSSRS